MQTADTVCSFR